MVGTTIVAAIWLALLAYGCYWLVVRVRSWLSPACAARRAVRAKVNSDKWWERRQARRRSREERTLVWAQEHPEDPTAKALLAEKSLPVSRRQIEGTETPEEALLRRQQQADEMERDRQARRIAEALQEQRMLEWALAHSATPHGRRHLEESLIKAYEQVEKAERSMRLTQICMGDMDGIEGIEAATRIADDEAKRDAAQRLIEQIQEALRIPAETETE